MKRFPQSNRDKKMECKQWNKGNKRVVWSLPWHQMFLRDWTQATSSTNRKTNVTNRSANRMLIALSHVNRRRRSFPSSPFHLSSFLCLTPAI